MDRIKKRVWIKSRRHWRSTHVTVWTKSNDTSSRKNNQDNRTTPSLHFYYILFCIQDIFADFLDLVNNSFWWNRSVNRAVERTMQTIAPPSFSCHKIVSSMSNNEGGETAIMSRKKGYYIAYFFLLPPFKRSFLSVCVESVIFSFFIAFDLSFVISKGEGDL